MSSPEIGDGDFDREKQPLRIPNKLGFAGEEHMRPRSPQHAFQTLSQSYITTSKDCSVQSCRYQFTSVELLMGNNKLLCENCTEKKQEYPKEISSAEKKAEGFMLMPGSNCSFCRSSYPNSPSEKIPPGWLESL